MLGQVRMGKKLLLLSLMAIVVPLVLYIMSSHSDTFNNNNEKRPKHLILQSHPSVPDKFNTTVILMDQKVPPTTPSRQTALAEHVWRTCNEKNMTAPATFAQPALYKHILVDDRFKILYCYVPKVACTNWRRVMLVLSGKVNVKSPLDITPNDAHHKYKHFLPSLSKLSADQALYRLDNYYKFMFVREPFERLLSAWLNKFQSNIKTSSYFHNNFGKDIVRRYRKGRSAGGEHDSQRVPRNSAQIEDGNRTSLADQLASSLVAGTGTNSRHAPQRAKEGVIRGNDDAGLRRAIEEGRDTRGSLEGGKTLETRGASDSPKVADSNKVRLDEFLRYLVDPGRTEPLNEHWEKYDRLCMPCSIRYDFVGHYEEIEEGAEHVLHAVHADHVVAFPRRSATYKHNSTSKALTSAYSGIHPALLREVYHRYRTDFELFDYKVPQELWRMIDNGGET